MFCEMKIFAARRIGRKGPILAGELALREISRYRAP
jgi:hypothetical protein